MKTLREMMDLIESAQAPVAEAYTPTAGELAQDLIGLADGDFNKKYGMSKQQANRYYSSSKLKDQGMAEGSASRTCPQCDGSGEDTLDPTKSCRRCGGRGHIPVPKEQTVDEDQATARMGLMSAVGSNDNTPADQRRAMAQQAVEQLASKR
jgi:RecJ-like exonuclease